MNVRHTLGVIFIFYQKYFLRQNELKAFYFCVTIYTLNNYCGKICPELTFFFTCDEWPLTSQFTIEQCLGGTSSKILRKIAKNNIQVSSEIINASHFSRKPTHINALKNFYGKSSFELLITLFSRVMNTLTSGLFTKISLLNSCENYVGGLKIQHLSV